MSEEKLIANRYKINEMIGEGGMGTVYRGTDTRNGQPVALKQLKQEFIASDTGAIERFRREVEALRRLNHPNIVRLLRTVKENGNYYIVMEYVGGGSLSTLMAKGKLPIDRVLQIALDLCDALTRAHRLNIIHRDLKPDNILLTKDGVPRLTDFGIARIGDRTRLTQSGNVMGTSAYLSPEACRGFDLDLRTDIWSFGLILFEMLTGQHPFRGDNPATIITSILIQPVPDIKSIRSEIPPALADMVTKMLEKDRDKRISSVRQVAAKLEAIQQGKTESVSTANDAAAFPEDFLVTLMGIVDKWETRAQESEARKVGAQFGDPNQAFFYRGVSETYKAAAQDIRELLSDGVDQAVKEDMPHFFVAVSRAVVELVLKRAGMKITSLYEDEGNIFTIVFPKIPPTPSDDRIAKLQGVCDSFVVLESGRLQDTQEPYIDFGFTAPPKV